MSASDEGFVRADDVGGQQRAARARR